MHALTGPMKYASRCDMSLSDRIRQAREVAGISQHRLAVALDVTGATIASWEHGRYEPRASQVEAIAARCGCSAAWLLTGEGASPVATQAGR